MKQELEQPGCVPHGGAPASGDWERRLPAGSGTQFEPSPRGPGPVGVVSSRHQVLRLRGNFVPSLVYPSVVLDLERIRIGRGSLLGAGVVLTIRHSDRLIQYPESRRHDRARPAAGRRRPRPSGCGCFWRGAHRQGLRCRGKRYDRPVAKPRLQGAGSVVVGDVPMEETHLGVPAKPSTKVRVEV